jgi:ribosomal protein L37E
MNYPELPAQSLNTKSKDHNLDDEDLSDCLGTIVKDRKENRPQLKVCTRCEARSFVNARFPYCMDCGWDSLEDPSWGHNE